MTNQTQKSTSKFDLVDRTSTYGGEVIEFLQQISCNAINKILINQVARSSTSIGANYMEGDCCDSKKDFCHKIGLCKKESKETIHWLRMLLKINTNKKDTIEKFIQEAHELNLIFAKIIINTKKKH